jgi:hypothetical protein
MVASMGTKSKAKFGSAPPGMPLRLTGPLVLPWGRTVLLWGRMVQAMAVSVPVSGLEGH